MQDGARRALGRVLVTGGAGFLGSALVARLARDGVDIVASDLSGSAGVRACDLTDKPQVDALVDGQRFDTIIHAGAVSGPMVMSDRPLDIWQINVTSTAYLLEAARRNRVTRFVLCSSVDVYGPNAPGMIDEDSPFAPESVYGASKVAAEAAMTGYVRQHGLDAIAVRFAWIYGPGRRTPTTLARLIRAGLAGEAVALDSAANERTHYLHIDDAVAGTIAAAIVPAGLAGRAYTIAAGAARPMGEVVAILQGLLPRLRVSFGNEAPPSGPTGYGHARAEEELGYRARVSLEDGLRRYAEALSGERLA